MQCPFCDAGGTRVVDSRPAEGGRAVRRRRECAECENRFTTYERMEAVPVVRKALADRPVPPGAVEALVRVVEAEAAEAGPEITSEEIGRLVLAGLRPLDEVAYLRFASVYKEFEGADDFEREMAALESDGTRPAHR
jgi:transcriptional repressor NrdR